MREKASARQELGGCLVSAASSVKRSSSIVANLQGANTISAMAFAPASTKAAEVELLGNRAIHWATDANNSLLAFGKRSSNEGVPAGGL